MQAVTESAATTLAATIVAALRTLPTIHTIQLTPGPSQTATNAPLGGLAEPTMDDDMVTEAATDRDLGDSLPADGPNSYAVTANLRMLLDVATADNLTFNYTHTLATQPCIGHLTHHIRTNLADQYDVETVLIYDAATEQDPLPLQEDTHLNDMTLLRAICVIRYKRV